MPTYIPGNPITTTTSSSGEFATVTVPMSYYRSIDRYTFGGWTYPEERNVKCKMCETEHQEDQCIDVSDGFICPTCEPRFFKAAHGEEAAEAREKPAKPPKDKLKRLIPKNSTNPFTDTESYQAKLRKGRL